MGWLVVAGWSCTGITDEAREQAVADVNLGRGLYAPEQGASDVRAAIVAWERAIRRDPGNAEAHLYLGQVMGEQGLFARAEPLLRRSMALYQSKVDEDERLRAPFSEARNSLAVVLINLGRPREAIPLLLEVTTEVTYPSPHLAWGNLGLAYLRAGRIPEATTALSRAVTIQGEFCVGFARLGEAYLRGNDLPHAVEALDRALSNTARGCDRIQSAYLHRAQARVQLHEPERAREDLARCTALGGGTPEGRECAELGRSVAP